MAMSEQEEAILRKYENDIAAAQTMNMSTNLSPYAAAVFGREQKQNLIEYELNFKDELMDIRRLLRCEIIVVDKNGNEYWAENPDKEKVFMNDLGVNDVLRHIVILVNKHKVLSNYNIEEINKRVRMITNEIRVLIYNNSEQYGIDNEYKMNNYSMMVLSIGSLIDDAYRRAIGGEGHKGLAEQRLVTQNEPLMPQGMFQMMGSQSGKSKHWYNPFSWRG